MATMLDAVINLKDNFSNTLQQVDNTIKDFSRTTKNLGNDIQTTGRSVSKVGSNLTKTLTLPIIGASVAAAKVGIDFEAGMSQVASTMGITVDEIKNGSKEFKLLSEAAKKMGRETQYSATEASEALNYLALAGFDANKSVEMLPKVLSLAAAGGLELGYASDLVTDSMSALGLTIKDADIFIDQMARTSQKANTDVGQLGEAILTVGGTAKVLKGGTLELNTALGLLANNGLKGAEGGTKLRNIIMAMTPTTDKAVNAFKALNVETYDAKGELRGLDEIFGDLNKSMQLMSTKEKTNLLSSIFNKQDMAGALSLLASTALSVEDLDFALDGLGIKTKELGIDLVGLANELHLYKNEQDFARTAMNEFGITAEEASVIYQGLQGVVKDGKTAWSDLEGKIKDSEGAAKEMADTLMYNLKGAITIIKSALEGLGIRVYENLKPKFDGIAKSIQGFIDKLNSLSDEQLDLVIKFAMFLAIMGPTLSIIGNLTIKVGAFIETIGRLGVHITEAGGLLKWLTSPAMLVVGAIIAIIAAGILLYKNWDTIKTKAIELKDKIMKLGGKELQQLIDVFKKLGEVIWESILQIVEAFKPLGDIIWEVVGQIIEALSPLAPLLLGLVGIFAGAFAMAVITAFIGVAHAVTGAITGIIGIIQGLVMVLSGVLEFLIGVFTGDWKRAFKGIEKIADGVIKVIKSLWQGLIDMLSAPVQATVDILDAMFKEKVEGIKKLWTSLKTFLKSPIRATASLMKNGNLSAVDGSHRSGLTRVPWDGYIAELHAGERVLTKRETDNYNKGQSNTTNNKTMRSNAEINIYMGGVTVRNEADEDRLAAKIAKKLEEASLNMA